MKKIIDYLIMLFAAATLAMYVFMLSSCETAESSGQKQINSIQWRAYTLQNHKLIVVENVDSLPLLRGDTVTVIAESDKIYGYYIANTSSFYDDTCYTDVYINNNDTTYSRFECCTVVLDQRLSK
jgi:hypothetical protein